MYWKEATLNCYDLLKLYPHISQIQVLATLEYASKIIGNEELLEVS